MRWGQLLNLDVERAEIFWRFFIFAGNFSRLPPRSRLLHEGQLRHRVGMESQLEAHCS